MQEQPYFWNCTADLAPDDAEATLEELEDVHDQMMEELARALPDALRDGVHPPGNRGAAVLRACTHKLTCFIGAVQCPLLPNIGAKTDISEPPLRARNGPIANPEIPRRSDMW